MNKKNTYKRFDKVKNLINYSNSCCNSCNRRKIKAEGKAKVVASVWGEEFIQFLVAQDNLPRTILKKSMNSIHPLISNHPGAIHHIIEN